MRCMTACAALALAMVRPAAAHDVPDFHTTAHSIAIVAILGDEMNRSDPPLPLPGGGFDDVAEHAMARQIATDLPDARVGLVDMPRDVLHQAMYPRTGFGDVGMDNTREALMPWAQVHPTDYIVVFRKTVGIPFPNFYGHPTFFGIGLFGAAPVALMNITVLDGHTLKKVTDLSLSDVDWGSVRYRAKDIPPDQLQAMISDIRAVLSEAVPAMTHGVGL